MHYRIRKVFMGFMGFIILGMAFGFLNGCDSGDKVINEATGNRALEQFKETKDKLNAIDEKQKERYQALQENEKQENK
jgi:hypothetical protein